MPTSDNAPADYGNEVYDSRTQKACYRLAKRSSCFQFRSDRRLKLEFGASRVTYRVQVCAIYDYKFDESTIDLSTIPERVIQLFDEISEGVSHPRPPPILAIEPADEGSMFSEVAVTRMEIVRRALSDRMIVALAIGVALAVAIAICVPFVICSAVRKSRHPISVKLASDIAEGKKNNGDLQTIKLSPMPPPKVEEIKY